jgi:ubiquinone/menaquinone biosynthesis C-methylase UbiE
VKEAIKDYWEERARENATTSQATTNDVYLRELEVFAFLDTLNGLGLKNGATILDVGCGDGYTTAALANALPQFSFSGLDYSDNMIALARQRVGENSALAERLSFSVGDATNLGAAIGDKTYDAVLTDRCLINLESAEDQARAIAEIAAHTKPTGHYVAIENFREGQDEMNRLRLSVGLPEIPIRWHNLFFNEPDFAEMTGPFFESVTFKEFSSSYYFATRVIYSAMCQMRGETPDYRHEIHQLAVKLPWFGKFSPIRMAVMRKRTPES